MENIKKLLEEKGYEVEVREVTHGSAIDTGFSMKMNEQIAVILCPHEYYSDEENAEMLASAYEDLAHHKPNFDLAKLLSWDKAKDNLILCLRKPLEDNAVVKDFLDMQMFVKIRLSDDSVTTVKEEMLEHWGIDKNLLFNTALFTQEYQCKSMFEALMEVNPSNMDVLGEADPEGLEFAKGEMYVVTNKNKFFGASVMADKTYMAMLAKRFAGDYAIVPSSVHEIIVVSVGDEHCKDLDMMIKEVNEGYLEASEVLSDHAYYYRAASGLIEY